MSSHENPRIVSKEEIPALYNQALHHYNAGNLPAAEKLFRAILSMDPLHAYSLNMLGMIALDMEKYEPAEELVRKALSERDDVPLFHNTLGNIFFRGGKVAESVKNFEKAVELHPAYADGFNDLGNALLSLNRSDEAIENFKKALSIDPKHFNALSNIGAALQKQDKHDEAIEYYNKALGIKGDIPSVYCNIGQAHRAMNRLEEAKNFYKKAIECQPDYIDALLKMGYALAEEGKRDEALEYFHRILKIKPHLNASVNIAHILFKKGFLDQAIEYYRKGLELSPKSPEILNNIGTIYNMMSKYEEAMECYNRALEMNPNSNNSFNNIGSALKNMGRLEEAISFYRKALAIDPGRAEIHSNLLLAMIYAASVSPEELLAEAKKFGAIADPLLRTRELARDLDPERKLRIGYVSADFRSHAVHYFFEPLLNLYDKKNFEIFIYSNTEMEDNVTERLKKKCDHWHDIRFMDDEAATDLIEEDKIDILMDISGHTGANRLMVFARKPAPVQVTWLAYPGTTGMKAMDYRITDSYAEPPGMTEHLNTETLWRLPEIFCCYQPQENSPPVIDYPPFEDNGYITFGCFNNFAKVTDPVLEIWGKIMARVPDSRLMLEISGIDNPAFRTETEKRLERLGIPTDRLILEPRIKSNQFILYNEIDMALDPFPCVGGTTSMDTAWMGVPLITLAGKHFVSRMGVTILSNAGLGEWIAETTEDYIEKAVSLANDRERLKTIRHNLREKVAASPLMNQESFCRHMEDAYRQMWRKYCTSKGARP